MNVVYLFIIYYITFCVIASEMFCSYLFYFLFLLLLFLYTNFLHICVLIIVYELLSYVSLIRLLFIGLTFTDWRIFLFTTNVIPRSDAPLPIFVFFLKFPKSSRLLRVSLGFPALWMFSSFSNSSNFPALISVLIFSVPKHVFVLMGNLPEVSDSLCFL